MKICRENPDLVKIGTEYQAVYMKTQVVFFFHVVGSDICGTTMNRTHCCFSMKTLSIFSILLTGTYVCQKYKQDALCVSTLTIVTRTRHDVKLHYIAYLVFL